MNTIISLARQSGIIFITLSTEGDKPHLIKFYNSFGSSSVYVESEPNGYYSWGAPSVKFDYALLPQDENTSRG